MIIALPAIAVVIQTLALTLNFGLTPRTRMPILPAQIANANCAAANYQALVRHVRGRGRLSVFPAGYIPANA